VAVLLDGFGPTRPASALTGEPVDDWFQARYATVATST
jgi:hypothetical protein